MLPFKSFLTERKKTSRNIPNNEGHELIHDDGGIKVFHLTSHKASKEIYGGGSHKGYPKTDWCTAGNDGDEFCSYKNNGNLYTIHSKDEAGNPQVHQLYTDDDRTQPVQYKGANDENVSLSKIPDSIKTGIREREGIDNKRSRQYKELSSKEELSDLLDSGSDADRKIIAEIGHKEHLDRLVNDQSQFTRAAVAAHGYKEHLDKLVNDPTFAVKQSIIQHTNSIEHIKQLTNDDNETIRLNAKSKLAQLSS